MDETKVIEVKQSILWENTQEADQWRQKLAKEGTFFLDVMASPGDGKTTLILALLKELKARGLECGVIEADLESDVDALKIKEAGVASVELNTKGVCHVEMGMVKRSFAAFGDHHFDFMVLENIGNLVCPADFDTGAHTRVMLLSVPEGYDKVYKYPPMFAVTNALIVTKCAYLPLNPDFDMDALKKQARALNPTTRVFETDARNGQGITELADWLCEMRDKTLAASAAL